MTDVTEQSHSPEFFWTMGRFKDNWVAAYAELEVEAPALLTLVAFLPKNSSLSDHKELVVQIDGVRHDAIPLVRGKSTTLRLPLDGEAGRRRRVTLISASAELNETDKRPLGFAITQATAEPLPDDLPAIPVAAAPDEVESAEEEDDPFALLDEADGLPGTGRAEGASLPAARRDVPLPYVVFPDYRVTNPYQDMIERSLPDHYRISYGTIETAIENALAATKAGRPAGIFHLHWTTPITGPARKQAEARRRVVDFLAKLDTFHALGGTLVWTIHNVAPHDARFAEIECDFCAAIGRRADVIHLHSMRSLPEIEAHFPVPHDRIVVIPHPSYVGVYPDYMTSTSARAALGLAPDVFTFLFLGQLRPYKGIDTLLTAAEDLMARGEKVQIVVAGKPVHPYGEATVRKMVERLPGAVCVPEFIPDTDLQLYYAAADVAVFPYRSVLTSGSVLGALSFGTPVIAPGFGAITEVVRHGETGWTYDPETGSLLEAMEVALAARDRLPSIREASRALAAGLTWDDFTAALDRAITAARGDRTVEVTVAGHIRRLKALLPVPAGASVEAVAVVVLCYRGLEDLDTLFTSLDRSTLRDFRVYLIDNASQNIADHALLELADSYGFALSIWRTGENLGYAGGNNAGIALALERGHPFIWVLNPDIEAEPDALERLVAHAEAHPQSQVVGAVILKNRKSRKIWSAGGRVRFEGGVDAGHLYGGMDAAAVPTEPYTVDYLTGASLFVRANVFREAGLLPEEYFLYFEETDWCLSVRRAMGEVLQICPAARLYHDKTSEKGGLPSTYYFYYFVRNAINFTRKFAPAHLDETVQRVSRSFVQPWLEKIRARSPARLEEYERISRAALQDGARGVTGRRLHFLEPYRPEDPHHDVVITDIAADRLAGWTDRPGAVPDRQPAVLHVDDHASFEIAVEFLPGETRTRRRFQAALPADLKDGALHRVRIVLDDGTASTPVPFQQLNDFRYAGRIDGVSGYELRGWVCNLSRHAERVEVEIICDDKVVATGIAGSFRADLVASRVGDGHYGYALRLPLRLLDGRKRTFTVAIAATGEKVHTRELVCPMPVPAIPQGSLTEKEQWLYAAREARYDPEDALIRHYLAAAGLDVGRLLADAPTVSVIMPAFNREDTIAEAIASVRGQSWPHFELIVVDDGSSDGTDAAIRHAIDTAGDARLRHVSLPSNRGVSAARNAGLAEARGDYIAYLDSDNLWQPDYLKVMLANLRLSGAKTGYCAQRIFQVRNTPEGPQAEPVSIRGGEFDLAQLENRNFIDLNCFMHVRSLVDALGGFNEKMTRLVDWELILRYCRARRPATVPALLSDYFIDRAANQITRVETHGDNLALLNRTQETEVIDEALRATHRGKIDLIVPLVAGGPLMATLRERVAMAPEVARTVLVAVGQDGTAALHEIPEDPAGQTEVVRIDDWTGFAAAVGAIAGRPDAAPFIGFVPAHVTVQGPAYHRLLAVFDRSAQARLASATVMTRVTDSMRELHPFAKGPNLFPRNSRPFRAPAAAGLEHAYLVDRLDTHCFLARSEQIAVLAPQLATAGDWSELCIVMHELARQTGGQTVVSQTAKVNV